MSYLALYIINPNNLEPDTKIEGQEELIFGEEIAKNVPKFMRIFAAVCFVIGVIGVILVVDPLEDDDDDDNNNSNTKNQNDQSKSKEIELHELPM